MFVHIIAMFTDKLLRTLYNLLLGFNPSWEYCNMYFLYMIDCVTVSQFNQIQYF